MGTKKHGSKRWILTYDGRIKKSNDRTWKDKHSDLKDWSPMYGNRAWRGVTKDNFCPQCKHVSKPIREQQDAIKAHWQGLRKQYEAKHGVAEKLWREYDQNYFLTRRKLLDGKMEAVFPIPPSIPRPPEYHKWSRKRAKDSPKQWSYDTRSYLCYKCEYKYETQNIMWDGPYPGRNKTYQWMRKNEYNKFRHKGKHMMQKAKYNEDLYDRIANKYKHGWLD
jgi:hypothetical protein